MDIRTVGIVGAGQMGNGIAHVFALAGYDVTMSDISQAALDRAMATIGRNLDRQLARGRITEADRAAALARIRTTLTLAELGPSDLIIEAATEKEEVKNAIFAGLLPHLAPHTILTSNTSSIPIAELAGATSNPDRVCGLHFFSPVPVMRLVEVVIALDTSEATEAQAFALAAQMGKQPIRTKDRSGFVVNMLLIPYLMAAIRMLEEGFASREDIDVGMQLGCGHPMGPLTLCDMIGLDVLYAVGTSLFDEFKRDEYAPPPLLKRMLAANRLGRKSGRGFYEYEPAPAG
ncbi:MAG: 3-hydroxybutyryl-CoA dehydrogenase [Bauldia sp.]|nr:MAG: 3-hydroxybutyryl-CoA dehydrogenase [Bauldia sp.]